MAKGSNFEREISGVLSLWWTGGERDDVFWRSAASGARATTRAKGGKSTFGQCGDIQAVDPIGQPLLDCFTIELKRGYSSTTIQDCLDARPTSATNHLEKFFGQVMRDADAAGSRSWMLIWRRDRRAELCFFDYSFFAKIDNPPKHSVLRFSDYEIAVVKFSDFLNEPPQKYIG